MPKKKIPLVPEAEANAVLTAVRSGVERKGYHWEPVGHAGAEAHEGGRQVKSNLFTVRLAMGAEIEDSALVLGTLSSGLGLVGATGHPADLIVSGRPILHFSGLVSAGGDDFRCRFTTQGMDNGGIGRHPFVD